MSEINTVWLLYRSQLSEKPAMVFADAHDAETVCSALNDDKNENDSDIWLAHVETMPVIGGRC